MGLEEDSLPFDMVPLQMVPCLRGHVISLGRVSNFLRHSWLRFSIIGFYIPYRIHSTDIFTYFDPIKINHTSRIIVYQLM